MVPKLFGKVDFTPKRVMDLHHLKPLGLNLEICLSATEYLKGDFANLSLPVIDFLQGEDVEAIAHLPFYGLQLGCKDPYVRELSRELLQLGIKRALQLGIKKGVMHIALPPHLPDAGYRAWIDHFCDELQVILNICIPSDFTLYLENTWEKSPATVRLIFDQINSSNLFMCLDIAHIYCFTDLTFKDWWDPLSPIIKHIHLSDNKFDQDSHLSIGDGRIDFPGIISTLQNQNITYTLETDPNDFCKSIAQLNAIWSLL